MKDIVEQLRHDAADKICPYFAAQTMEIAANEIVTLRIIAAQHRDARLAALEELAKHQGPALDVDVWPNAEIRGRPPTETTNGDKDHD